MSKTQLLHSVALCLVVANAAYDIAFGSDDDLSSFVTVCKCPLSRLARCVTC